MAAYDLEEQEQLAEIKAWWERYGNLVVGILFVAAMSLLSWQGWSMYTRNKASQANAVYESLVLAANKQEIDKVRLLLDKLRGEFANSVQTDLAAMIAVKAEIAAKDTKKAQLVLDQEIKSTKDLMIRDAARLQLAALQLDDKAYDEALKTLSSEPEAVFAARFADLQGDIYFAKGASADALVAYKKALDLTNKQTEGASPQMAILVQAKIDALGGV